jgi:hypothetical protein
LRKLTPERKALLELLEHAARCPHCCLGTDSVRACGTEICANAAAMLCFPSILKISSEVLGRILEVQYVLADLAYTVESRGDLDTTGASFIIAIVLSSMQGF